MLKPSLPIPELSHVGHLPFYLLQCLRELGGCIHCVVFSRWLLSLSNMCLSFLLIFPGMIVHLFYFYCRGFQK